jgi:hypothetical protein
MHCTSNTSVPMFHNINDTFVTPKSVSRISNHWWILHSIQHKTKVQTHSHAYVHVESLSCTVLGMSTGQKKIFATGNVGPQVKS